MFSANQFIVKNPGCLPSGYGREGSQIHFHGRTVFGDAATGTIWIKNKVYLGVGETVMANIRFEEWIWE